MWVERVEVFFHASTLVSTQFDGESQRELTFGKFGYE